MIVFSITLIFLGSARRAARRCVEYSLKISEPLGQENSLSLGGFPLFLVRGQVPLLFFSIV